MLTMEGCIEHVARENKRCDNLAKFFDKPRREFSILKLNFKRSSEE